MRTLILRPRALTDEMRKLMAQTGIWRAGTETPTGLAGHPVTPQAYERTVAGLKNAYENKVPLTFSTDADDRVEYRVALSDRCPCRGCVCSRWCVSVRV